MPCGNVTAMKARVQAMEYKTDAYNDSAAEYAEMVTVREERGIEKEPSMPRFLEMLGDVAGLQVLDAGCGEGYLSRILADRGAEVTGIDIAPRLVDVARAKDLEGKINYQVVDLSQPQPAYQNCFDLIASFLVINDVYDYRGFITTLSTVVKPGGRLVLVMNNPYSFAVRGHIKNYFDSGGAFPYRGMAEQGVKVHFYHRTLEEYLDAFLSAGFQLRRLVDIPAPEGSFTRRSDTLLPAYHFPFFMILSFTKPI